MILGAVHDELRVRIAGHRVEHNLGGGTDIGLGTGAVDVNRRDGAEFERSGEPHETRTKIR